MKKILLMSVLGAALFSSMQTYAASVAEYALILAITAVTGTEPQDLRVTESRATYYYRVTFTDPTGTPQSADCYQEGINDDLGDLNCTLAAPAAR